jgi:hypothetical protein
MTAQAPDAAVLTIPRLEGNRLGIASGAAGDSVIMMTPIQDTCG